MDYRFHPAAEAELNEAIDYYEAVRPGLGAGFAGEVKEAINRALRLPRAWSYIRKPVRRSLVNRFPYGVLYVEQEGKILILAVMNLHREPDYWAYRQ